MSPHLLHVVLMVVISGLRSPIRSLLIGTRWVRLKTRVVGLTTLSVDGEEPASQILHTFGDFDAFHQLGVLPETEEQAGRHFGVRR